LKFQKLSFEDDQVMQQLFWFRVPLCYSHLPYVRVCYGCESSFASVRKKKEVQNRSFIYSVCTDLTRRTRAPTSASLDVPHKPNVNVSYCSLSHCCHQMVLNFHVFHVHPTKEVLVVTS